MNAILVIDDDESVRHAIEIVLRRAGYEVVLAPGAEEGIVAFEAGRFSAVVVDIFMPGADGLDLIERFRVCDAALPIIASSGFRYRNPETTAPDFLKLALERGANCALRKPFRPNELMDALESCLAAKAAQRARA